MPRRSHTAAGSGAGYIFQVERALQHLANAPRHAHVAIEHIDDVVVLEGAEVRIREQNKHSVQEEVELLGDRSLALWRTLQIWLSPEAVQISEGCRSYVLAVNKPVTTPIALMLKNTVRSESDNRSIITALRAAGVRSSRRPSKLQSIIDDVLSREDDELTSLISRIEIVEQVEESEQIRRDVSNAFAIDGRVEESVVLNGLLGWLTNLIMEAWRAQRPAIISKEACIRHCRASEDALARQRLLPRASRQVLVTSSDRDKAMTRPFVHHLVRIDADEDNILQAVDQFIQFNIEKHRLTDLGDMPPNEWLERGDRLKQRWSNIARSEARRYSGSCRENLGMIILEEATYDHKEPLDGQPCVELYMTSGHYHRLADDDEVWWHPDYGPKGE